MQDFINKKILLGVCGSIAAYKSAYLVRELTRLGAQVRVVMTQSAQAFVTPLTFQALSGQDVRCDVFDLAAERAMGHIELARWADYVVIAPASANCLAKMAHGFADDLLSTLYLVAEIPVILCPSMNRAMWEHSATQANSAVLRARGVSIVGPDIGMQACGEEGFGRMCEPSLIIDALRTLNAVGCLQNRHVVITAGATCERIDPVRYLTNDSSGKMGYALAQAAYFGGARVTLISGPSAIEPPLGVVLHRVESASAMAEAVMQYSAPKMIFIGAAAVADYYIAMPYTEKVKKHDHPTLTLTLKPNVDIVSQVTQYAQAAYVVGFAAETTDLLVSARRKREAKQLDMIIANDVSDGAVFGCDENEVTVITQSTEVTLPLMHKTRLAGEIISMIAHHLGKDNGTDNSN